MIKCKIRETGEIKVLSITNSDGIDYIGDFIGNSNGFVNGNFVSQSEIYQECPCDDGCKNCCGNWDYETSQENFDWWSNVVDAHQEMEDRIEELNEEYGIDVVHKWLADEGAWNVDLEDQPSNINESLDRFVEAQANEQ